MLLQNSWRFPKDADTCWLPKDCKKKATVFPNNMSTYFITRPPGAFTIFGAWPIGPSLPTADHLDWKTLRPRLFRAGRPAKVVAMRSRKKYSLVSRSRRKGISPRNSNGTSAARKIAEWQMEFSGNHYLSLLSPVYFAFCSTLNSN